MRGHDTDTQDSSRSTNSFFSYNGHKEIHWQSDRDVYRGIIKWEILINLSLSVMF